MIKPITPEDQARFLESVQQVLLRSTQQGIGTLSEKTIHATLKNYYSPTTWHHEAKVGRYYADILIGNHILEIQTRQFNTMRKKLEAFLPDYKVTIIYPVAHTKWLQWIDEETGELTNKRKVPKRGTLYNIMPELYKIKPFLLDPNLNLRIVLIDVEETRLLNGWSRNKKKGASRNDGMPTQLVAEVSIETLEDYAKFLPEGLPSPFTTKDYKKCAKVSEQVASTALNILYYIGTVERVGKKGNAFLYEPTMPYD